MEEKIKVKIVPTVLHYIGLLFCTLFTFLGLVYVLHGNLLLSGFLSLLVLTTLLLITTYLTRFKSMERSKKYLLPEYILGIAYFLIFILISPLIFHFIDVDFNRKNELKKNGIERLNSMKRLIHDYENAIDRKVNSFKVSVETNTDIYFMTDNLGKVRSRQILNDLLGVNTLNFARYEINQSNLTLRSDLKAEISAAAQAKESYIRATYLLGPVQSEFEQYYNSAIPVFENWKFLKISYYYYDIGNMRKKVNDAMCYKMPDFNSYHYNEAPIEMNHNNSELDNIFDSITNASIGKILILFLLIILMNLLVLAPYIAATRKGPIFIRPKDKIPDDIVGEDINKILR